MTELFRLKVKAAIKAMGFSLNLVLAIHSAVSKTQRKRISDEKRDVLVDVIA